MTLMEGLVIATGLAIGYWFVSVFLPHAKPDMREDDRRAASERAAAPAIGGLRTARDPGAEADTGLLRPWYEVLEVDPCATREEIRVAYQRKLLQHHPDRTTGATPELRAVAQADTHEIHEAYEAALRALG